MSKHTSGPWEVREHAADICITAPGFREPALIRRIIGHSGDCPTALRIEQAANARLISAAPDLLAALETLVAALPEDGEWAHFIDIKDAARAAIAKATS